MEMDYQPTAASKRAYVGVGVPPCPAERSSASVASCRHVESEMPRNRPSSARLPRRGRLGLRVIALVMGFALRAQAQTTSKTVRHHKVAVDDPSSPPALS